MSFIARGSSFKDRIHFTGPGITDAEIENVIDAVKNGWLDNYNRHVLELEEQIQKVTGTKYALATHCGTVALHLCMAALDLKPGDEVICPDFSYVASSYAIDYVGATPVFVDIDSKTWCIDPQKIESAVTAKTKAIMVVHTFGHHADMPKILEIAEKYNLWVVEDAAPAVGTTLLGKPAGTWGDFGIYSFNGTKIVAAGEGGCVFTDDSELFDRVTSLASMGRTDHHREFWSERLGFQYCMGNLSAAVTTPQLKNLSQLIEKKRQIYRWYRQCLENIDDIEFQQETAMSRSNWSYPTFIINEKLGSHRDYIVKKMREKGILARSTFPQMSLLPPHKIRRFDNPNSKNLADRGISLPSALHLNFEQVTIVCKTLIEILDKIKDQTKCIHLSC